MVAVDEGQGSASAVGNGTMLRIVAADTTHLTVGARTFLLEVE